QVRLLLWVLSRNTRLCLKAIRRRAPALGWAINSRSNRTRASSGRSPARLLRQNLRFPAWHGTQMEKRRSSNLRECLWVRLPPVLLATQNAVDNTTRPVRLVVQDARFSFSRHGFDSHT